MARRILLHILRPVPLLHAKTRAQTRSSRPNRLGRPTRARSHDSRIISHRSFNHRLRRTDKRNPKESRLEAFPPAFSVKMPVQRQFKSESEHDDDRVCFYCSCWSSRSFSSGDSTIAGSLSLTVREFLRSTARTSWSAVGLSTSSGRLLDDVRPVSTTSFNRRNLLESICSAKQSSELDRARLFTGVVSARFCLKESSSRVTDDRGTSAPRPRELESR
mmetsp:Transcript_9449/g.19927  ORF Transcript_9449/g.19927 Transcript_9449/m.19927 type:complete len:218 (+) Transcript_9449:339-992(+)